MPITDYDNELTYTAGPPATSKQSIVATAGVAVVGGKVMDGIKAKEWGAGEVLAFAVRVVTALVGATGGVQFDLVGADNAALSTNPVVLATKTIPAASLTLNALLPLFNLGATGTKKQFLGIKMTPLSTNSTAGEVIVFQSNRDGMPQDGVNWL